MQPAFPRPLVRIDDNDEYYGVLDAIVEYSPQQDKTGRNLLRKIKKFDSETFFDGLDTFPEGVFKTVDGHFEAVGTIFLKFENGHPANSVQAIIKGRIEPGKKAVIEDIDVQIPNP
jgi:hypothetical protein